MTMARITLLSALAIGSALGASSKAVCDRACLKATLDQYLNAVVAHNPAAAPLSVGFRQTENAMVRRRGDGLWESAKGLGKLQRRYFDVDSGQAGYFGTLEDAKVTAQGATATVTAIVTLRIRVEDRKITEAEWVISRKGDPGIGPGAGGQADAAYNDVDYLLAHPPAETRVVPKGERVSRGDLVAIANSYFDGLTAHDGKIILAHPGCVREENGILTTQRPLPGGGQTDCTGEGAMTNIYAVTARRYPLVDDEAGVVLGLVLFQRKPGVPWRRNLLAEWFTIEQGKIRSIYAAMYYPDQDAVAPNWEPYDGNWAIQPPAK